jgi:oxygen-independent coproporphyrinogen-3 oxidase
MATNKKKRNYIKALIKELQHRAPLLKNIKTIYIGGGTPLSLHQDLLEELLETIKNTINLNFVTEYTIETNPNNITNDKIDVLLKNGINRISIGVQSFNAKQLAYLGRDHDINDIHEAIRICKNKGLNNINIDMIFSLIHQTIEDLNNDIDELLTFDVNHISYYSLILEEKTILYKDFINGKISLNSEDLEAVMFETVINRLTNAGYVHYEISNFAKTDYQSQHNKAYWFNHEYLGIGSGAHSHANHKRFSHIPNIEAYIRNIQNNVFDYYEIEEVDDCADRLLVGLRMMEGINLDLYHEECGYSVFDKFPKLKEHINADLVEIIDGNIRLTKRGISLGNIVFETFIGGD